MKIKIFLLFSLFFLLAAKAQAQNVSSEIIQQNGKTIVSVPVTVSDREGRYVSGLKKSDFTLFQNGIKQEIDFFATFDEPLNIALLLDTSGSTTESLNRIRAAGEEFIGLLNAQDKCLIATFDSQVRILTPLTSEREALAAALAAAKTAEQDGTLLRQAIEQIASSSFNNVQGRKVIVVLSDGKDIGSRVSVSSLRDQLEESDVLIYSIYYNTGVGSGTVAVSPDGMVKVLPDTAKPKKRSKPKKTKGYAVFIPAPINLPSEEEIEARERQADIEGVQFLREISDKSAGRFYVSTAPDLKNTFKKIAAELREQYRLGFQTNNSSGKPEVFEITVKVSRPDAVVRTRGTFRAKKL